MADYFPMFIDIRNKRCLVVGGGRVALHKIKALKDFGIQVMAVAPTIIPEIQEMEGVTCCERHFRKEDLKGQAMVVAATDDPELNHRISQACKEERIPVNAVDQPEDCSFIFPAYLKEGGVVAAFSSGGQSPAVAQYLKEQMRPVMTPLLGSLAERLGGLRERVRQIAPAEARKEIYREILRAGLEKGEIPSDGEVERVIREWAFEKGEVSMCTLFDEIAKESEAIGEARGEARGIIETGYDYKIPENDILQRLQNKLNIPMKQAQEYLDMFKKQTAI